MTIAAIKLMKTRVGRAFVAIRDSEIAAEAMGINLSWYKTLSFAVSAFYTGIGGAFMAFVLEHVSAGSFNLILSITFLAMIIVGGLGSVMGSILGAALLTYLQIKLQSHSGSPGAGTVSHRDFPAVFHAGGIAEYSQHCVWSDHDWHRDFRASGNERHLFENQAVLEGLAVLGGAMNFFFDLVIGGLSIGACYALVALAMVIIYKTSEVPNFAQGEMAMIATFVAYVADG